MVEKEKIRNNSLRGHLPLDNSPYGRFPRPFCMEQKQQVKT